MPARIGKYRDSKIGGAVNHGRMLGEGGRAGHETAKPHHAGDAIEVAVASHVQVRQHVHQAEPRRFLALFHGDAFAEFSREGQLARVHWQLP
jgi:hypothetical protein